MSHSWLQRKRKGELIDLAQKARLPDADGLLKDDLVDLLGSHLNSNETTFAKNPDFRDYYGRTGSPVKRERSSRSSPSEPLTVTKTTTRRRTIIKDPSEDEATPDKTASTSALVARTPRAVSRRVSEVLSEVDIPASPAQLAQVADQSLQSLKAKATSLWSRTRITHYISTLRESASSVATVQTLILLLEATTLQYNTLDTTPIFTSPTTTSREIRAPNLSALLTADFWAPATLWSLTSWVLPLIVSYFINLTLLTNTSRRPEDRQYPADPLVFNIARAVLAYSAYRETVDESVVPGAWGPFGSYSVARVGNHVLGGYWGLQIGSCVGVLVSIWDGVVKK